MLQFLYYFFFSFTLFYGLYYLMTSFYGFFKPKKFRIKPYLPKNKFAIIVAARNEEAVVGHLVESLLNSNYPRSLFDVYVAVNNTTDNTAKVAKKAGAIVIDVKEKVKSKGEVLRYVFKMLKSHKDIDAYIIFDADNIVHPDFLSRMNDTLCSGYRVAEGFRDSKNMTDNWISGSTSLFYYMQNFFFNKSRMTMGISGAINGTGFMISKEKVDSDGFNTKTLTEDIEFTAQCALHDEPIAFVEGAITYDEQPVTFNASWKQRKRWSVGTLQCFRLYNLKLWKHFFKTGNQSAFDMFMNFIAPIIQVICLIEFFVLISFRVYNVQLYDIFSAMYSSGIFFLLLSYVSGVITSVFVIKYNQRKAKNVISSIVLFAIFILTWIPINVLCIFKKDMVWEEIKHKRGIDAKELNLGK
jgi:cellulose synthase/poly-beta-1,6-N-acetylglucosamine synthase-like glycosyltransferase